VITATAYDRHVEQLFDLLHRVTSALGNAGVGYRVIGGVAVFLHVSARDPLAARLTRDIDLAIDRTDLERIGDAVRSVGLEYRHAAGVDRLVDSAAPAVRSAVHLIMVREKVLCAADRYAEYEEAHYATRLSPHHSRPSALHR
jgi:hypothetical protein